MSDLFGQMRDDLQKALDLATGTGVLTQPKIDKVIQDTLDHNNPFRANLPRKPGEGEAWLLNRKTAQASGAGWVNDTEEPSEGSITRERFSFTFKTLLERGKVTTFMQKAGRSYRDLLADELNDTTQLVKDLEEDGLINGNTGTNAKQFDGLRVLTPAGQVVSAGPGPLSIRLLDEGMDKSIGRPNMLVMAKRTRRELWSLLASNQRFVDSVEVKGGFRVTAYSDAAIFYSKDITTTQGGGTESDLFILDTEWIWVGVLEEFRSVFLAKTSSQFDSFDIRGSEVLVLANPTKGIARISGIIPPS
jgi:hypothetical protein